MSFKKKMQNRGISKLDNLVETPDYITVEKPIIKQNSSRFAWLKVAIPVLAGLVILAIPTTILIRGGLSISGASKQSNYDGGDKSDGSQEPSSGEKDDEYSLLTFPKNSGLSYMLEDQAMVENALSIKVYNYPFDSNLVMTLEGETATEIIDSLKLVPSNYDGYVNSINNPSINRNSAGYIMGINHKFVISDGNKSLELHYFSQLSTIVAYESAFDISGRATFTLLDALIEMDYDPTFDETK